MKLIQLLAAVMGLSLMTIPFARAQETETPTDKSSPTPAETETKKSEEEAKPKAEKNEVEKTAPQIEKAQKKEKPAAATSGNTARPMAKGSAEAQLKDIEMQWEAAFKNHDAKFVESILGEGYVLTNEKGKVFNRKGAIKEFKKDTDVYEKTSSSDVVVHLINRDAAVVTGMAHEIGKDKSGKPFDRTFRWTDTFVNHGGAWQAVATHVTLIAQK